MNNGPVLTAICRIAGDRNYSGMSVKKDLIKKLNGSFSKRFNLLVVDDYPEMGTTIVNMFSSPLFRITYAASAQEAHRQIAAGSIWHCWILDIAMEEEDSGLKLLSHYNFPFVIMLSGMRSMNIASKAMQLGAFRVFDKDPNLLPSLHMDVCSLAALAWILRGSRTKYFSIFLLLAQMAVDSTETWANQACLTVRQLERICSMHSHLTPRFFPPLYYSLKYLLQLDEDLVCCDTTSWKNVPVQSYLEFVEKNLDVILNTMDTPV